jgi:amyloid beta precursor protein binding protein 1
MSSQDSQDIETATTAIESAPDTKTRRYDRQLRLWAVTGQSALESSRVLLISGSATSTSILKNLVLPGIGHFTILDHAKVSHSDAGNNFFLEGYNSIGKSRAEEAVKLLSELNDSVEGCADTRNLGTILESHPEWITSFTIVIAHNLDHTLLSKLSVLLWKDAKYPPLVVVRSAGFLADFYIQFHEHTIIESHSEISPSLRIDKPFPALREHALSLEFDKLDSTEHGHIPYVVILVRALEDWKKSHGGSLPKSSEERQQFKKGVLALKVKGDEENFDEAEAQAYRCWTETKIPSEVMALFSDPALSTKAMDSNGSPFFHLLAALKEYAEQSDTHTLPLTSTLPDMKSDTHNYIHLQRLYKTRAEEEKRTFKSYLRVPVDDAIVDSFVKNAHALVVLRGKPWGTFDEDKAALAESLSTMPKETCIHLALSALSLLQASDTSVSPSAESIRAKIQSIVGQSTELPDEADDAIGEIARAPFSELPNTAAFLGGMVAQEVIKMVTKQYVPVKGYCVIDLIETWTGTIGA